MFIHTLWVAHWKLDMNWMFLVLMHLCIYIGTIWTRWISFSFELLDWKLFLLCLHFFLLKSELNFFIIFFGVFVRICIYSFMHWNYELWNLLCNFWDGHISISYWKRPKRNDPSPGQWPDALLTIFCKNNECIQNWLGNKFDL